MAGAPVAVAHTGGIVGHRTVGSGNGTRMVSAAMFANALRYHTGGVAGLKPDEVPTILRRNEEVLTEQDPRIAITSAETMAARLDRRQFVT